MPAADVPHRVAACVVAGDQTATVVAEREGGYFAVQSGGEDPQALPARRLPQRHRATLVAHGEQVTVRGGLHGGGVGGAGRAPDERGVRVRAPASARHELGASGSAA